LNLSLSNEKNKIDNFIENLEKSFKKNKLINDFNINLSFDNAGFLIFLEIFTEEKTQTLKNQLILEIKSEAEKQSLLLSQN